MFYLTQLIYIKDGQENVFDQFENKVISIISKYNGRLLLRIRPIENTFIENNIEKPYEVHLLEFDSEPDFQRYLEDKERKRFMFLKEQSIEAQLIVKGTKL